jgi:hypothetical protein
MIFLVILWGTGAEEAGASVGEALGVGGCCRHPEDWVPPHISSKLKQEAVCASTRCHASYSFGPQLPVEVGSGATTCPTAPNLTSLLRWVPVLPRGTWPQASSTCWVELRRRHTFLNFGPRLPAEVGSDTVMCPMALGSTSLRGELWRSHMFLSSGPHLSVEVGSGAAT